MLPSVRCCKTFRSSPEDIEPKARYDNKVRQAVIDLVLVDKLNTTTVGQALERDFLLKLSTGFLYHCLEYAVRKYDGAEFRAKVLSEFSGSLCVDQIHLGHRVVLLASDPVSDNPIACALVSKNDAAHMLRFLRNLKNPGFSPQTVISDRSPLYPKAIAEIWPDANHQLCVFHVITIRLKTVTRDGDQEIHVLTNLPSKVSAVRVADLYRQSWTLEQAFNELTDPLALRAQHAGLSQGGVIRVLSRPAVTTYGRS